MAKKMSTQLESNKSKIAVVIPCYREKDHILDVLAAMGPEITSIFVVDDRCPDGTGEFVQSNTKDKRITVIRHEKNLGVGGATLTGYKAALETDAEIIVKVDGDGQMDPAFIRTLVHPIQAHEADYTKGNRLHRRGATKSMPFIRLLGNMGLTLMSKFSSGYWDIMDPTNGFTAIHQDALKELPLDDIAHNFFFESDLLYHLSEIDAVVRDVPMRAKYGEETSHLIVHHVFGLFLCGHIKNGWRRMVDTYFVRDFSIASVNLILGNLLVLIGAVYGGFRWWQSIFTGIPATAGTAILSAMLIIVGTQLLLAFINHDTRRVPTQPIHEIDQ